MIESNLDSLKVDGIHHCTLKKLDGGVVTLEETFQLKVGLFSESVVGSHMTHHPLIVPQATSRRYVSLLLFSTKLIFYQRVPACF